MKITQLIELLKLKIGRTKGEGGKQNVLLLLLLLLSLGVSMYFNLTAPNRQVVFNFDQQIDSIRLQTRDSVANEITNYYTPRILQYEELVASKNEELTALRQELNNKNIQLKKFQSKTTVGVTVRDESAIPISRVKTMLDSISETLKVQLTNQVVENFAQDSLEIVNSLVNDSTFVKSVLDRMYGEIVNEGRIQFTDTATNLKYYGVIDLESDSLHRTYIYNISLSYLNYLKYNGPIKRPTLELAISSNDPRAVLDVETYYTDLPKLNFSIGVGAGGAVYMNHGVVKFSPAITFALFKPIFNFYQRK